MAFLSSKVLCLVNQGQQKCWLFGAFLMLIAPSFIPSLPTYFGWPSPHVVSIGVVLVTSTLPQNPASFRRALGSHWIKGPPGSLMPVLLKLSPGQVSIGVQ